MVFETEVPGIQHGAGEISAKSIKEQHLFRELYSESQAASVSDRIISGFGTSVP